MAYIGIDRNIVNHWIYKDSEYFITWFEMIYRARYSKEPGQETIEGKKVLMEYGQFIFGRTKWSERLKITERRLRTLIDRLVRDGMITLVSKHPKFTIYQIVNYEKYNSPETRQYLANISPENDQHSDQQETLEGQGFEGDSDQQKRQLTTSKRPASDQQVTTKEESKESSKKVKKVKKDIIPKINFAEFVSLTQEEHDKLIAAHGEDKVKRIYETLDNYKGSTGKKYTSDYRTILNWVINRVDEDDAKKSGPRRNQRTQPYNPSGKPRIEIVESILGEAPSDEEFQKMMEKARQMKEAKANRPA